MTRCLKDFHESCLVTKVTLHKSRVSKLSPRTLILVLLKTWHEKSIAKLFRFFFVLKKKRADFYQSFISDQRLIINTLAVRVFKFSVLSLIISVLSVTKSLILSSTERYLSCIEDRDLLVSRTVSSFSLISVSCR